MVVEALRSFEVVRVVIVEVVTVVVEVTEQTSQCLTDLYRTNLGESHWK